MPLKFEDLPPKQHERINRYDTIVEELKSRAGDWAVVPNGDETRSSANATCQSLRKRGCDVATRTIGGKVLVYSRWPVDAA